MRAGAGAGAAGAPAHVLGAWRRMTDAEAPGERGEGGGADAAAAHLHIGGGGSVGGCGGGGGDGDGGGLSGSEPRAPAPPLPVRRPAVPSEGDAAVLEDASPRLGARAAPADPHAPAESGAGAGAVKPRSDSNHGLASLAHLAPSALASMAASPGAAVGHRLPRVPTAPPTVFDVFRLPAVATPGGHGRWDASEAAAAAAAEAAAGAMRVWPRMRADVPCAPGASNARVRCVVGHASDTGRRATNEDAVLLAPAAASQLAVVGVFDGHGGDEVSGALVARLLPQLLAELGARDRKAPHLI